MRSRTTQADRPEVRSTNDGPRPGGIAQVCHSTGVDRVIAGRGARDSTGPEASTAGESVEPLRWQHLWPGVPEVTGISKRFPEDERASGEARASPPSHSPVAQSLNRRSTPTCRFEHADGKVVRPLSGRQRNLQPVEQAVELPAVDAKQDGSSRLVAPLALEDVENVLPLDGREAGGIDSCRHTGRLPRFHTLRRRRLRLGPEPLVFLSETADVARHPAAEFEFREGVRRGDEVGRSVSQEFERFASPCSAVLLRLPNHDNHRNRPVDPLCCPEEIDSRFRGSQVANHDVTSPSLTIGERFVGRTGRTGPVTADFKPLSGLEANGLILNGDQDIKSVIRRKYASVWTN